MATPIIAPEANSVRCAASATRIKPKYPGIRVTCNGNQLVTQYVEARITEGGVFYPITPSTEGGELYQQSYAQGELNVFGQPKIAIECEGEHAAQGGRDLRVEAQPIQPWVFVPRRSIPAGGLGRPIPLAP